MFIEPKEITIDEKVYTISKLPAVEGREIMIQYPSTALPKIGDYKSNEALMYKLLGYVQAEKGDMKFTLNSKALINNHVKSWETLLKLEWEMMKYNFSFFMSGTASISLTGIVELAQVWISKISTASSGASSVTGKPPSES